MITNWICALAATVLGILPSVTGPPPVDAEGRPRIIKLGMIDCDLAETTPVVFRGRLLRFGRVEAVYDGSEKDFLRGWFPTLKRETGGRSP